MSSSILVVSALPRSFEHHRQSIKLDYGQNSGYATTFLCPINFLYLVEIRFNAGKIIRSDKDNELLLNRLEKVVFVVVNEQLFFSEQRHFPLHKLIPHKTSHSDRMVTFVICQRDAIVEFIANQRTRINLKIEIKLDFCFG